MSWCHIRSRKRSIEIRRHSSTATQITRSRSLPPLAVQCQPKSNRLPTQGLPIIRMRPITISIPKVPMKGWIRRQAPAHLRVGMLVVWGIEWRLKTVKCRQIIDWGEVEERPRMQQVLGVRNEKLTKQGGPRVHSPPLDNTTQIIDNKT